MAEIVQMRGLLDNMEGLTQLGAVHKWDWTRMCGYSYSIPVEIRVGGATKGETAQAVWTPGWRLRFAIEAIRGRDAWSELTDDAGAVYFSKREPAPALTELSQLQAEIESSPKSKHRLILACTAGGN